MLGIVQPLFPSEFKVFNIAGLVETQRYNELSRVLSQTMISLLYFLIRLHTHATFLDADWSKITMTWRLEMIKTNLSLY